MGDHLEVGHGRVVGLSRSLLYADLGAVAQLLPASLQAHTLWAVVDWRGEPVSIEAGIGHGLTAASPPLILKLRHGCGAK